MNQIRAEVVQRKKSDGSAAEAESHQSASSALRENEVSSHFRSGIKLANACSTPTLGEIKFSRLPADIEFAIKSPPHYQLADFLRYDDKQFVENAYRGILNREADPEGLQFYLKKLRNGSLSKTEVLGLLRYSVEFRKHKLASSIKGLFFPTLVSFVYRKIPIVGYIFKCIASILLLPQIIDSIWKQQNYFSEKIESTRLGYAQFMNEVDAGVNTLVNSINNLPEIPNFQPELENLHDLIHNLENKLTGQTWHGEQNFSSIRDFQYSLSSELLLVKEELEHLETSAACHSHAELSDISLLQQKLTQLTTNLTNVGSLQQSFADRLSSLESLQADLDILGTQVTAFSDAIDSLTTDLETTKREILANQLENQVEPETYDDAPLTNRIEYLEGQIHSQKIIITDQQRRLAYFIEETRKRLPETLSTDQLETIAAEADHQLLDALYVTFEDRFRGTRENIKNRQRVYLPYLEKVKNDVKDFNVIDLGCGRGEWLELLRENEIPYLGVDVNQFVADHCKQFDLDVVQSDALEYLRAQKSNSVGMITGFHIIEHIPFRSVIILLDEALRVLKPGGMIIFETPNIENLTVGSCTFYIDPSHLRPVHPDTIKYMAEARGYIRVEILPLHPKPEFNISEETDSEPSIEKYILGPRDYSLIGYKA